MKRKFATLAAVLALTATQSASASHNPRHMFYNTVDEFCGKMIDAADAARKASNLGLPLSLSKSILSGAVFAYTSLLAPMNEGMQARIEGVLLPYADELATRAHFPIGHDWSSPQQTTMCAWVLDRCVAHVASILAPYTNLSQFSIGRAVESWANFNAQCPPPFTISNCTLHTDNDVYLRLSRSCQRDLGFFPRD